MNLTRPSILFLALSALALAGCPPNITSDDDDDTSVVETEDNCSDSFDNDGDGPTDCADPDCETDEACAGDDDDDDDSVNLDEDGDGWESTEDCNDDDAEIFPGAPERCNAIDDDCDGMVPNDEQDADGDGVATCEGDCDDLNAAVLPTAEEICDGLDNNCDGELGPDEIDADADGFGECEGDCDDADPAINPLAAEACNNIDDNCDGTIPMGETDVDGDGEAACAGDCNDLDAATFSTAAELCDNRDNNCDGTIDEGFPDNDGDGMPDCFVVDADGDGFTPVDGDCNDGDAAINPGAAEECDSIDNDCDGSIDEDFDVDADGWSTCIGDCDDGNVNVFPGADETPYDGIDQNCDGRDLIDVDGDGDGADFAGGSDCNDEDASINVSAEEIPYDGIDQDCDGEDLTDVDGDGELPGKGGDCDDEDPAVNTSAEELNDGIDNDCDGLTDEATALIVDAGGSCGGYALDGSSSFSASGPLLYAWTIVAGPVGVNASLDADNIPMPMLTTEGLGEFILELTVDDGATTDTERISVTVEPTPGNLPPVADAGTDLIQQEVSRCYGLQYNQSYSNCTSCDACEIGEIGLDGSGSTDPEGAPLTYQWTVIEGDAAPSAPNSAVSSVVGASIGSPTCENQISAAALTAELTVWDCEGASSTDTVVIDVSCIGAPERHVDDPDEDNDGLLNITEDFDLNAFPDEDETDYRETDTDRDGIQDGTEAGLGAAEDETVTDLGVFIPDEDAGDTTTDPLDSDTDGGGVPDGDEDVNGNGIVDPGETDPNDPADDLEKGPIEAR